MTITYRDKYKPDLVLKVLKTVRKEIKSGTAPLGKFVKEECEAVLFSMLKFPDDIPEKDSRDIVKKAISETELKGAESPEIFLDAINKFEAEFLARPIKRYVLATSISINKATVLPMIKFGNKSIIFEPDLPPKYTETSYSLVSTAGNNLFAELPNNYLHVRVSVTARSDHQAADQALELLDFIRGLWNWDLNIRHPYRNTWGGKAKPVNSIILGPVHTLHKPNGNLASYYWWYENNYLGAVTPYSLKQEDIDRMNHWYLHVKNILKKHKYPKNIINSIVRYAKSLDERDWTTSFIRLWSILEMLSFPNGTNHEKSIQRTAFLFKDYDYHLAILRHLKDYRNSKVHMDKENNKIELYLYELKNYVEILIGFHINNKFGFSSLEEAAEFLDLPHEDEQLKKVINKYNNARYYREFKKKPTKIEKINL